MPVASFDPIEEKEPEHCCCLPGSNPRPGASNTHITSLRSTSVPAAGRILLQVPACCFPGRRVLLPRRCIRLQRPGYPCCCYLLLRCCWSTPKTMVSFVRSKVISDNVFGVPYTDPVSHMCLSSVLGARPSMLSSLATTFVDGDCRLHRLLSRISPAVLVHMTPSTCVFPYAWGLSARALVSFTRLCG